MLSSRCMIKDKREMGHMSFRDKPMDNYENERSTIIAYDHKVVLICHKSKNYYKFITP